MRDPDDVRLISDPFERYQAATAEIERYQAAIIELGSIRARAATVLSATGRPYREVGEQLGLSTPRVAQLVASSDREAELLKAWVLLEKELLALADCLNVPRPKRNPGAVAQLLLSSGWLANEEYRQLRSLRTLRNQSAHAVRSFTSDELDRALDSARSLTVILKSKREQCMRESSPGLLERSDYSMAQLRQFLYRDSDLVREFLAQLEGGLYEEDAQTVRSSRKSGLGGSAKAGVIGAQAERAGESSDELARVVRQTGASEFERLYQGLGDDIQFMDNIDESIWSQVRRGEIVEVEVVIRRAGFDKMLDLFSAFEQMLPVMEAMGSSEPVDRETMQMMQLLRTLNKGTPADTTPVIATLASAPRFKFACMLRTPHLLVDPDLLEGEATLFGKIRRKLQPGESHMLGTMFGGLEDIIPEDEMEELAKMFDDPQMKALGIESPRIEHPAAVLTPIAVYR